MKSILILQLPVIELTGNGGTPTTDEDTDYTLLPNIVWAHFDTYLY